MLHHNSELPRQRQQGPAEIIPLRGGNLQADRAMIVQFANAIYRNCKGIKGWIALRSFDHVTDKCVLNEWVRFKKDMIDSYMSAGTRTANLSSPAVFAPPACLFKTDENATLANVAAGPVISVDLDVSPKESKDRLEAVLGRATVVVASGGKWTAPDGTQQEKLHVYWRLRKPAVTPEELAELSGVRKLARFLADGDGTNDPISHPIRCPGSWHTKAKPRLCRIVESDHDREIELSDALERLEAAVEASPDGPAGRPRGERQGFKTEHQWSREALLEVAEGLSNTLEWKAWNEVGMTFYDASHGSENGNEAFHRFSERHEKYDPTYTDERWGHYRQYPPSDLSGASLTHRMREGVDPCWCPPRAPLSEAEKADLRDLFGRMDGRSNVLLFHDQQAPLDIFQGAEPMLPERLPGGAVPPILHRWIKSESRRKGAPEAFAALSAVTVIAAAIGSDVRLQVRQRDDSWTESAILWSVLVADPGHRKSPVIGAAMKPLQAVDNRWSKRSSAERAKWEAAARKRGKNAPDPGPEPKWRRAVVDDFTTEGLTPIFRDNPRGVIAAPDELSGLLGGFGAYKAGRGSDRAHFLRSFDGDSITVDRKGSGRISADRAALSVLAGTQPDKLRTLAGDLGADGLLQRFLVVLHDGRGHAWHDEEPDREAADWFAQTIERLTALGALGACPVAPLKLTPEAGAVLAEAQRNIERLKHIPGAPPELRGHLEKWGKLLPRLILVMHVARAMSEAPDFDPTEMVESETVDMAARFGAFLLEHSLAFYMDFFGAAKSVSEARQIAGWLLTRPELTTVTRRDIYDARKSLRGEEKRRVLLAAMSELETFGWCTVQDRNTSGPTSWKVNPGIHTRFNERAERERQMRADARQGAIEGGRVRKMLRLGLTGDSLSEKGVFG